MCSRLCFLLIIVHIAVAKVSEVYFDRIGLIILPLLYPFLIDQMDVLRQELFLQKLAKGMEDQLKSPRFLKYKSKRIAQIMSPPLHLFLLSLGFKNKEAESAVFFLVSYFRLSFFPLLTTFTFHLFCFLFNFMTTLFCSHRTKRNSGIIKIETPPRQSNFPLPDLVYYPFRVSCDIATRFIRSA